MEKKQTALKWFVEQLGLDATTDYKEEIEQALQMEREQIQKAFVSGDNHGHYTEPSEYYKQTYGGQDE
jgi:hypothetical protein